MRTRFFGAGHHAIQALRGYDDEAVKALFERIKVQDKQVVLKLRTSSVYGSFKKPPKDGMH